MNWEAKATGDMTLSFMDGDFQILKVDMLGAGTLKACTDGAILIRTLNDLHIIANFSQGNYDISDDSLEYPGGGISPLPWSISYDEKKRRLTMKSRNKKIADRTFPDNISNSLISEIVQCISNGLSVINTIQM